MLDDHLKICTYRAATAVKRVFYTVDHQTDEQILRRAEPALERADIVIADENDQKLFVDFYRREKLKLIMSQLNQSEYEMVQEDQLPTRDLTMAAWLIKNQTKALATEKMTFLDFRAPIEIEAFLVPDDVM